MNRSNQTTVGQSSGEIMGTSVSITIIFTERFEFHCNNRTSAYMYDLYICRYRSRAKLKRIRLTNVEL